MHLNIDSVAQKHTVSLTGDTTFAGNFGLWQGSLDIGSHKVTLDYCGPAKTNNNAAPQQEWNDWSKWMQRKMIMVIH